MNMQSVHLELFKDLQEHIYNAKRGDVRSIYAAQEVYERLLELGFESTDQNWVFSEEWVVTHCPSNKLKRES